MDVYVYAGEHDSALSSSLHIPLPNYILYANK